MAAALNSLAKAITGMSDDISRVTRRNVDDIVAGMAKEFGKSTDDIVGMVSKYGDDMLTKSGAIRVGRNQANVQSALRQTYDDLAKGADDAAKAANAERIGNIRNLSKKERTALLDEKLGRTPKAESSIPRAETRVESSARRRNKRIDNLTTKELSDTDGVVSKMNLTDDEVRRMSKEQRAAYNRGQNAKSETQKALDEARDAANKKNNAQKLEDDVNSRFQEQTDESIKRGQKINEARNSAARNKETERYVGGMKAKIIGAGQDIGESWKKSGIHKSVRQQRADIQRFINDAGGINGQQVSISQVGDAMKKLDVGASAQDVMDSMIAEIAGQSAQSGAGAFDGIMNYFKENQLAAAGALVGGGLLVGNMLDND